MSDIKHLKAIINNIKRILDLDVDLQAVEKDLQHCLAPEFTLRTGIRLPGIWSMFEAGIRAILGQQISIGAARNLVSALVIALGEQDGDKRLFPTAQSIANSDIAFLKTPASRKQTLRNLAQHYVSHPIPDDVQQWLNLKGIGPWTAGYAQMRGLSHPDIFLGGDLGIKKVLGKVSEDFQSKSASPWRSYLTFQLWSQL